MAQADLTGTPNLDPNQIGAVVGSVPFGALIRSAAMAIAEAQAELDKSSMRMAEMFSGAVVMRDPVSMLPIDSNGAPPARTSAGAYYQTNGNKFEPTIIDTRVFFGRNADGTPMRMSLIELGFTPNFYQFIETLIEIKISVTVTKEVSNSDVQKGNITTTVDKSKTSSVSGSYSYGSWWWRGSGSYNYSTTQNDITTTTTPVDAAFSAKYNYAIEASSLVRTKLVPVPPPPILEQRVRQLMDIERRLFDQQLRKEWVTGLKNGSVAYANKDVTLGSDSLPRGTKLTLTGSPSDGNVAVTTGGTGAKTGTVSVADLDQD